jgi:hypothetical protein
LVFAPSPSGVNLYEVLVSAVHCSFF